MKKTLKLFGLVALSAFVFSCTKETALDIEKENITPADEQQAETPDTPVIPATDGGLLTSFGVTFEGQQDADTKVTVDLGEGTTAIENGDEVLVYVSASNKAVYAYNKDESKFELSSGGPVTLNAPASVFYPADEFDEETGVFTMPAAVTDLEDLGDKAPMAGQIEGSAGAYTVDLKNLASVLKVGVTGATSNTLTSVTLAATGKSVAAGAAYTVDFSGARPVLATEAADDASSMVVSAGGAALSGTAQTFFFLVPAGLSLGDVTVTATLGEDHNGGNDTFSVSQAAFTPVASKISGMSFYAGLFSGGAGTPGDPYKIATARDFKYISKYCAEGYALGSKDATHFLYANYRQVNDLNINEDITAYMIGSSENPFAGTYVGYKGGSESKTILRTAIIDATAEEAPVGIFRNLTGTIKHISVAACEVKGKDVVGALVGTLDGGTVSNCIYSGSTVTGSSKVGGLVGEAKGSAVISDCETQTADNVNPGNNTNYVGGIVGVVTKATVSKCVNKARVTGKQYVGGIAGEVYDGKVYACKNGANVTAANTEAGGIAGRFQGGTIRACYSSDILISGYSRIGGIAGYQSNQGKGASLIINCGAKSNIRSTNSGNNGAAGGLVGYMYSAADKGDVVLTNSVALGSGIYNTWKNTAYLGAIVGEVNGAEALCYVRNCYSQHNSTTNIGAAVYYSSKSDGSTITSTKQAYMGGIYGYLLKGTIQNCYCVGSTTGGISSNALVGAGTKDSGAAAGNTRMIVNAVKNGTQAVNVSTWTFYPSGIKDSSATSAYLEDIMNLGTWETAINGNRFTFTSSEGTPETVCEWVGLNGTSHASYDPAYPSELKILGYIPQ